MIETRYGELILRQFIYIYFGWEMSINIYVESGFLLQSDKTRNDRVDVITKKRKEKKKKDKKL